VELIDDSIMHFSLSFLQITTGFKSNSLLKRTSTSGLLCRSTTCDGKFCRQSAPSKVARMAFKYGAKVFAYNSVKCPLVYF